MDLCLYAKDHGIPAADLVQAVELDQAVIARVFEMIEAKRKVAKYLHAHSLVVN
jgi:NAD+ synthase